MKAGEAGKGRGRWAGGRALSGPHLEAGACASGSQACALKRVQKVAPLLALCTLASCSVVGQSSSCKPWEPACGATRAGRLGPTMAAWAAPGPA